MNLMNFIFNEWFKLNILKKFLEGCYKFNNFCQKNNNLIIYFDQLLIIQIHLIKSFYHPTIFYILNLSNATFLFMNQTECIVKNKNRERSLKIKRKNNKFYSNNNEKIGRKQNCSLHSFEHQNVVCHYHTFLSPP
jgi:hypothetical protein